MIEFIKGEIAEITPTYAVIECSGIGYMLCITLSTYSALENVKSAKLLVHEVLREEIGRAHV